MNGWVFIFLLLILCSSLGIVYVSIYNSFQKYLLKIKEVESTIDILLRERFDLLNKASSFIKDKTNEEVMKGLIGLEDKNLSSFELDRTLVAIAKEFYDLKFKYHNLVKLDAFTDIDFAIKENEAKVDGYILYYNDNITKYNHLIKLFPSSIIAKISKLNEKLFYDGKNMSDSKTNDFKM